MADQFLYLDETGTLDFEARPGEAYFGVGTVHYEGDHASEIWDGHQLRCELEAKGISLTRGLHAKNDSASTRSQVYDLIALHGARFDSTMLRKDKAYPSVQAAGKIRLYKMAVWLHLKHVIYKVSVAGDRIFVIAGHLQTSSHRDAIRNAVKDVCGQLGFNREVVPCIWEAPTAWGIQAADYMLWRVQREVEGKSVPGYATSVDPLIKSQFKPWG